MYDADVFRAVAETSACLALPQEVFARPGLWEKAKAVGGEPLTISCGCCDPSCVVVQQPGTEGVTDHRDASARRSCTRGLTTPVAYMAVKAIAR